MFTYARVKWFYGQSERAYYLNYFIKRNTNGLKQVHQENHIDSQLKKKELLGDQNSVMTKLLLILTTRKKES